MCFVMNKKVKTVKAELPTGQKSFSNVDRGYLLELGTLAPGTEVKLTADEAGEPVKCDRLPVLRGRDDPGHDRLNQSPMYLTSWKDTKLSGTVSAAKAGMLFTSIPLIRDGP